MKRLPLIAISLLLPFALSTAQTAMGSPPAFPGAYGYGKNAVGGRGGDVIFVTNTWDSGPGSFREACEAQGPRTVIFRVGGKISLKSPINITNPYITIAGQTAPGGGILLRHKGTAGFTKALLQLRTHDIIIRHLRLRRGPSAEGEQNGDCLFIGKSGSQNVRDIIIDHCSLSWSTDEIFNVYYEAHRVTAQNCIFSEALENSTHMEGGVFQPHSMGVLCADESTEVTLYRNLFAHNRFRNPWFKSDKPGTRDFQFINNIVYNYGENGSKYKSNAGLVQIDSKGNYYFDGGDTNLARYEVLIDDGALLYVQNNIGLHRTNDTLPEWDIVGDFDTKTTAASTAYQSLVPFTDLDRVPTAIASDAVGQILNEAGAILPATDAVDMRIVNDVVNGTGEIIDHPNQVGGYPPIASGTAPTDSDNDGMPDSWEDAHSLNKTDPNDRNFDLDNDGYTNLEEYLNGDDPNRYIVEAEHLDMFIDYSPEEYLGTSNAYLTKLTSPTGSISLPFNGPTGSYEIRITYLDEAGGSCSYKLLRNASQLASWTGYRSDNQLYTKTAVKNLTQGDELTIAVTQGGTELGRIDSIEFIAQ